MSLARLVPINRLKYLTKIREITIDDITFRLHYRFTFSFLLIGSLLLAGEQFFGKPIQCINTGQGSNYVPDAVINSYCWIEGTFTLPKGLMKIIGYEVSAPGIEQYKEFVDEAKHEKDEILEHTYYQWVGVVLFLQSLTFYTSHLLWKIWEKNKMSDIVNDLNKAILETSKKNSGQTNLVEYLYRTAGSNNNYAFRYFLCEIINFINVVLNMIFINWFLGGQFTSYGLNVLRFLDDDYSQRVDPMAKTFPKMTKCTFRRFGPSGDIIKTDHLCLLPLNILNEKMYVVFWFWLYLVAIISLITIIVRLLFIISPKIRNLRLTRLQRFADIKDLKVILDQASYADWFVIHMIDKNIDPMHFRDVMKELAAKIKGGESKSNYEKQVNDTSV